MSASLGPGSANQRRPREQLLVHHDGDNVALDLYLDATGARDSGRKNCARGFIDRVQYANDLDDDERARYTTANRYAKDYAGALEQRYLARANISDMLTDQRRFYRLPLDAKLGHIAKTAAWQQNGAGTFVRNLHGRARSRIDRRGYLRATGIEPRARLLLMFHERWSHRHSDPSQCHDMSHSDYRGRCGGTSAARRPSRRSSGSSSSGSWPASAF